jgi:WD40 repeat protein
MGSHRLSWLLAILVCGSLSGPGLAAEETNKDRRASRAGQELILDTGGRTATCDVLTFTADGRYLLATGDDKAVRVWECNADGLYPKPVQTLRWSIWREQRGSIYALALDRTGRRVVIGGYGIPTGMVVVLDRTTGQVEEALPALHGNTQVIRAVAFSPSGRKVAFGTDFGTIWLWDLDRKENRQLGRHRGRPNQVYNRARFVGFQDETHLLSVAQEGAVLEWNLEGETATPTERFAFEDALYRVVLSPDRRKLAAATMDSPGKVRTQPNAVRLWSLGGGQDTAIRLKPREFVRSLAFDPKGERMAVGIATVPHRDDSFSIEDADQVAIYDLRPEQPRRLTELERCYHADALAFHPDGKRLAVAGGDNHEVTLWDVAQGEPSGLAVRGAGHCLWSVGFSRDRTYIGFRQERNPNPSGPNDRGTGPWRVFDLNKRKFVAADRFTPIPPLESTGGWSIRADRTNPAKWWVVGPRGEWGLPLTDQDQYPRCFTFLAATDRRPARLVVGHYWGLSVFALDEDSGPQRVQLLTGHQGEVMAVAPSDDGRWIASASRDQTLAVWDLDDWPSGNELGARFHDEAGRVLVDAVDIGSPAYEAGLTRGDEVAYLGYAYDRFQFNPENRTPPGGDSKLRFAEVGDAAACVRQLGTVSPGKECIIGLRAPGSKDVAWTLTTVRRRPHWRFFPAGQRDWVLWLWRSYFYDTSQYGDSYIGWNVNARDLSQAPTFYRAERFKQRFQNARITEKYLWDRDLDIASLEFEKLKPPVVKILPDTEAVGEAQAVQVKLRAYAADSQAGNSPDEDLESVELWLDDSLFAHWEVGNRSFEKQVTIPRARLRSGTNQFTLQCFNRAHGRSETSVTVQGPRRTGKPNLYGLVVGIDNYSNAVRGPRGERILKDLAFAVGDALAIQKAWKRQQDKMYGKVELPILQEDKATRAAILARLRALAQEVGPDDQVILFLGGHGDALSSKGNEANPDGFVYCCPNYDPKRPQETGITNLDLYHELARLPCRKLVLLDVCHSGFASTPSRGLMPGGKGPTVLTSCERGESAIEDPAFRHGLFSYAVTEALEGSFDKADQNKDGYLQATELAAYIQKRIPTLLAELKLEGEQNPTSFPETPDPRYLAEK